MWATPTSSLGFLSLYISKYLCGVLVYSSLSLQDWEAKDLQNVANSAYTALWRRSRIHISTVFIRWLIRHVNLVHYLLVTPTRPLVCIGLTTQALLSASPCVFIPAALLIGRDDTRCACSGLLWAGLFLLPHGHTCSILESRTLIFQNTKTKIHSRRHLAMLLLHCELHKLYRKWQANADYKTLTGGKFPHEGHGWEIRTWRSKTYFCQSGELEPVVTISCNHLLLKKGINLF
jgi:hypothetical protein